MARGGTSKESLLPYLPNFESVTDVLFSMDDLWAELFHVFCANSTLSNVLCLNGGILHIFSIS